MTQSAGGPKSMRHALVVLALVAALVGSCGGSEPASETEGEALAGASATLKGTLAGCQGDACTPAPPDCEEDQGCMEELCAPESGGCEAVMRPFDPGDGLRACFDLRVTEVAATAETGTASETKEDTTDTGAGTDAETPAETIAPSDEEQEEGNGEALAARIEVECRGPQLRLEGVDPAALELQHSEEGEAWAEQPIRIRGQVEDGVFRVTEGP
jgi:septal ring-binding cell division protein DamX